MKEQWIPLASIPQEGAEIIIDNQNLWKSTFDQYALKCTILEPIIAHVTVLPQEDGVYFSGVIQGKVALECDRCSEDSIVTLTHQFDSFESYPLDPYVIKANESELQEDDYDETVIRNALQGRGIDINPSSLAWQEFSIALPAKPLCSPQCSGLCPVCGCNKNKEKCDCEIENADPRFAVLRNLTIKK